MTRVRKTSLAILAALLAVCIGVGLASCGGKDTEPTYGYGEEGTYYSDTSEGEYLLTLRSGTFVLSLEDGTGTSGTYEYRDGALYMTYYGEEEATECSYSEGVIRLTWSSQTVTFLKREYYTVTFTDGSSTITTQSVLNGRAAQDPGEPTKEGYVFLGWYADSSFTERYEFNTSVTSDTTIYARFIEIEGTTEYKITYDFGDGETEESETINGRIYDLPEAEMSGYAFIGWWVSATNSADELTYKYTDETLDEDTTLFAVYASGSYIGASIKDGTLTWLSSPASQMNITVTDGEGGTYSYDTQTTASSFAIVALSATGTYSVTVSCGGVTENLTYISNGLSRVSGFTVISGSILMYGAVANAERYYISIECGNPSHDHTMIDNGTSLYYDFSSCEMPAEGITFTVYAYADGYVSSESAAFNYFLGLDKASVTVENGQVMWERVSLAQEYEVYIDGVLVAITSDTSYSLSNYGTGTYEIEVKPVTTGYYSEKSDTISFTKTTLASPTITNIENYTITWTPIEGATGYIVSINGIETTVSGDIKSLILTDENYEEGLDSYEISVKATAEDSANDSPYGESITVTGTSVGSAVSYSSNTVTWQYSLSASEYRITVNDGDELVVTGTNSSPVTLTKSGNNEITIYFVNDEGDIYGQASVTVYAYAIVFDARGGTAYLDGEAVDVIYVAKGDTVSLPYVEYTSGAADFGGWYTLPDLTANPDADSYAGDGVAFEDGTVFTGNSTIVLYAFWLNPRINVRLEAGDGMLVDAGGNLIDGTQIALNSGSFTIPVPTIDEPTLAFAGWYSGPNGTGTRYTDQYGNALRSFSNTSVTTLYAYWGTVLKLSTTTYNGETVLAASKGSEIDYVSEITIPETYVLNGTEYKVGVLNSGAFSNCSNLQVINIPDTILYINVSNNGYSSSTGAFYGTDFVAVNIYVTGDEPSTTKEVTYYSEDGVLFDLNSITGNVELYYYPHGKTDASYEIPEVVSNEYEYELDASLNEVHVERTVNSVSTQVFRSNDNIVSITFPATISNIDSKVFYGCSNLQEVKFNATAANGTPATSLTMDTYVFQNCTALVSVTLPAYMTGFDTSIFSGCSALENIYIVGTGGNYTEKDGLLCNSDGTEIVYAAKGRKDTVTIPSGVTVVGEGAFQSCTGITALVVPAWVTRICESAFQGCTALETIEFQGGDYDPRLAIEEKAFYGCTALTELTLPSNLDALGANAFGNCSALATVYYDSWDGAQTDDLDFASGVFLNTNGTSYIKELVLGAHVPMLEINDIFGGTSLATVTIDASNPNYYSEDGVVFSHEKDSLVYYPIAKAGAYEIPSTVTTIGARVFWGRTYLTAVTIPSTVTTIGEAAFSGCTSLAAVTFEDGGTAALTIETQAFYGCTKLASINLPDRLTAIGDEAFYNCSSLSEIYIPANVAKMGGYTGDELTSMSVFEGCSSLTAINVDENNTMFGSLNGILYAKESGELVTLLVCPIKCSGDNGTVVIPSTVTLIWTKAFYNNSAVRFIENEDDGSAAAREMVVESSAFQNCKALLEMELPYGMKTIAASTFSGCTVLTTVKIPNSVTSIESGAFTGCSSLSDVSFYGDGDDPLRIEDGTASSSGAGAFAGLTRLTSVTLPERTSYIGISAFRACSSLKSINIPSSVTCIGDYAFYGTSVLIDISMDAENGELETIGQYAFYLSGVRELMNLPETLDSIGANAFSYSSLEKIYIPSSVTTFGSSAFSYARDLKEVTFGEDCRLTEITGSCFTQSGLVEIEIPAMVESIGSTAFGTCTSLEKVTFAPNSHCTYFDTNCFYRCSSLKWFAFPDLADEVMEDPSFDGIALGASMFYGCGSIEYMYISAGVYDIVHTDGNKNAGLFSGVSGTAKTTEDVVFEISPDNEYMWLDADAKIIYGKAFDENGNAAKGTELILAYGEIKGEYSVPYGVTSIAQNAFKYQTSLTKVTFPSTLTEIDYRAFHLCTALEEIVFADGINITSIGDEVFRECTSLKKVDFGNGTFSTLGSSTFYECESLEYVTLPEGLTSIGSSTFYECTSLKAITIPEGVTTISSSAFRYCYALEEVNLPSTLTTLAQRAFGDCTSLTHINLEETAISSFSSTYVFSGCTALKSVTIPASLGTIGNYAFQNCTSLETVVFEDGLKLIGGYMFDGCSALKSADIPSTVTSIGTYAFRNCTSLESVTLPSGVDTIGTYTFYGCESLKTIGATDGIVDLSGITSIAAYAFSYSGVEDVILGSLSGTGNSGTNMFFHCESLKSVTFTDAITLNKAAFSYCTALESLTLSADVTITAGSGTGDAAQGAFAFCTSLKSVSLGGLTTVPGYTFYGCTALDTIASSESGLKSGMADLTGVTTIQLYAFYNCSALRSLLLPDTTTLGNYAFYGCSSLTVVDLSSVTSYGTYDFANCTSLETIVFGAGASLGNYAFDGCSGLKSLDLTGVTSLGTYVFRNCTSLEAVVFGGVTSIGNYDFDGCSSLKEIDLTGVTSLGTYVFRNCTSLVSVTMDSGLTSLGNYDFYGCESLKEIDISGVTSLGTYVFYGCTSLESVTLNSGVTSIGNYDFYGCENLTEIFLPDSLTSIGTNAFEYCYSLKEITIGARVTSISNYAFAGSGIINITVNANNTMYKDEDGVLYTLGDVLVYYPSGREGTAVLPAGTTINSYAFSYNEKVTEVILPEDLTTVTEYAFRYCYGLERVTMPSTLVSIGQYAFGDCTNLAYVTLNDGLQSIGNYAFYCTGVLEIEIPATVTEIGNYAFSGNVGTSGSGTGMTMTVTQMNPLGKVTFLTDDAGDTALTSIGTYAFRGTYIEEVEIPATVTSIGNYAFFGCTELEKVTMLSNPATLGTYMFAFCTSLCDVTLPEDMTVLSNYMFFGCTGLEHIDLPDTLMFLGTYTFATSGLKEVTLPRDLVHFGTSAGVKLGSNSDEVDTFYGCENLETLVINEGLQSIGTNVFANCTSLKTITYVGYEGEGNALPEGLEMLGYYAFRYCTFDNIYVPSTVTTMYQYVFADNPELKTVTLGEGLKWIGGTVGSYVFSNCTALEHINIPDEMGYIASYTFRNCTSLDYILLNSSVALEGNVFNGWTENQKVYIPISEYSMNGPAASSWNNTDAAIYYYMEKPAFNTYIVNTGANYWYWDDDGDIEIEGRRITEWRYEDVASDEVDFALDSNGSFVAYYDSEDYIFGMRIYDASTGNVVYYDAVECVKGSDGTYRVTLAGGYVYDVTMDAAAKTATATLYAAGYAVGAADSGSYVSVVAGDTVEIGSMYLYAGTPGDYLSYEIVATEELTGTDADGASYTYYHVTTDTGETYFVTLNADGTATVEEEPHEYAEILVENYEGALDGYEISGFTFEIHIYGVFDLTSDTVVNVRVILSVKLSVITLYTFDFYYDEFECRTEYGTDASGNTTAVYYVSADGYTFMVTMNDDGTCTAIMQ